MREVREVDEAVLMSSDEEFLAGLQHRVVEDAGQVMAYGDGGDAQAKGNVLVGKSLSKQDDDPAFPFG